MIGRLQGILLEKMPPQVLVDIHGVGYEVDVSMNTFYQLPAAGESVTLYIHQQIREDAHLLYGFISRDERHTFRTLIKITGIGAKIALGILSALNADELAAAVAAEDVKRLSSVPGIGKKTAERLVLELRGKLTASGAAGTQSVLAAVAPASALDDVANALVALGYSEKEAAASVKNLPVDVDVGEGVRLALKGLVKG